MDIAGFSNVGSASDMLAVNQVVPVEDVVVGGSSQVDVGALR